MDKNSCFNCSHKEVCWLFIKLSSEQPMTREFSEQIASVCKHHK